MMPLGCSPLLWRHPVWNIWQIFEHEEAYKLPFYTFLRLIKAEGLGLINIKGFLLTEGWGLGRDVTVDMLSGYVLNAFSRD